MTLPRYFQYPPGPIQSYYDITDHIPHAVLYISAAILSLPACPFQPLRPSHPGPNLPPLHHGLTVWILDFGGNVKYEVSFPQPRASHIKAERGTHIEQNLWGREVRVSPYLSIDGLFGEEVAEDLESTESLLQEEKWKMRLSGALASVLIERGQRPGRRHSGARPAGPRRTEPTRTAAAWGRKLPVVLAGHLHLPSIK